MLDRRVEIEKQDYRKLVSAETINQSLNHPAFSLLKLFIGFPFKLLSGV